MTARVFLLWGSLLVPAASQVAAETSVTDALLQIRQAGGHSVLSANVSLSGSAPAGSAVTLSVVAYMDLDNDWQWNGAQEVRTHPPLTVKDGGQEDQNPRPGQLLVDLPGTEEIEKPPQKYKVKVQAGNQVRVASLLIPERMPSRPERDSAWAAALQNLTSFPGQVADRVRGLTQLLRRDGSSGYLQMYRVRGSSFERLSVPAVADCSSPRWSPDGAAVTFVVEE